MKIVFFILLIAIVIILIEVPSLLEKKGKRELEVFFLFLFFSVFLSIIKGLKVDVPNPFDWLTVIYSPIINFLDNIFK